MSKNSENDNEIFFTKIYLTFRISKAKLFIKIAFCLQI